MPSPTSRCRALRSRPTRFHTRSGHPRCCSVGDTVRGNDPSRAFSDDAVREGTVVLIDDVRPLGAQTPTAVRRAGNSVLLLGAREAAEHPAPPAPPLRLSKFHAPEIVFGPGSVQEAAHAAVRMGARRPLVVTDPGLLEAGWPERAARPT